MLTNITLRNAALEDASAICNIYNFYVLHATITFEEVAVTQQGIQQRITEITKNFPWLVAELNNQVVGYAYVNKFGTRSAYRYSAESPIYLHADAYSKGIDRLLYLELIRLLKKQGIHTLIAGVTLPNPVSIALHEKLGFKSVAHYKEVGFKQEKWLDVVYW